ncbi:MAG: hypothetical protein LUD82_02310, partial [Clostridiales bacterium]|nr:hypothetical protein [Clostridiales bacterium]
PAYPRRPRAAPTQTIAKIGTICSSEQYHSQFRWYFMAVKQNKVLVFTFYQADPVASQFPFQGSWLAAVFRIRRKT